MENTAAQQILAQIMDEPIRLISVILENNSPAVIENAKSAGWSIGGTTQEMVADIVEKIPDLSQEEIYDLFNVPVVAFTPNFAAFESYNAAIDQHTDYLKGEGIYTDTTWSSMFSQTLKKVKPIVEDLLGTSTENKPPKKSKKKPCGCSNSILVKPSKIASWVGIALVVFIIFLIAKNWK